MQDMKLVIFTDWKQTYFRTDFSVSGFPEGMKVRKESYTGQSPERGEAVLLLTDSKETVEAVEALNYTVIYLGKPEQSGKAIDKIEDVWDPEDGSEILALRYRNLLRDMKARFDADFYKSLLLTTIDTVPDMLWYKREDGIHTLVNHAFTEIVHKTREDVMGKDHFYIWDAPRPAEGNDFACAESEEIAIRTGKTYVCDEPVTTREGMKQFTTYKTPVYDTLGNLFGTVGVGHDVTNFSNLGIELSILVEHMPFPMTIFTRDWKVVRMNTPFMEVVGSRNIESFDYKEWKSIMPIPVGKPNENTQQHSISREYQIEVGGSLRNYMLTELEIRDFFDNVSGYFCTMLDITYQRAYEKSIIRTANTDMLTGMYNRRYVYNYLNQTAGSSLHFLYLDLDRFKAVNDRYGHSIGDDVLIKTSEMIDRYFPDGVTARLGGDEFAVIDDKNTRQELERRCDALKAEVEQAFEIYKCGTTISVGIAYTDGSIANIDELIHESDKRMYEEKKLHHEASAEADNHRR